METVSTATTTGNNNMSDLLDLPGLSLNHVSKTQFPSQPNQSLLPANLSTSLLEWMMSHLDPSEMFNNQFADHTLRKLMLETVDTYHSVIGFSVRECQFLAQQERTLNENYQQQFQELEVKKQTLISRLGKRKFDQVYQMASSFSNSFQSQSSTTQSQTNELIQQSEQLESTDPTDPTNPTNFPNLTDLTDLSIQISSTDPSFSIQSNYSNHSNYSTYSNPNHLTYSNLSPMFEPSIQPSLSPVLLPSSTLQSYLSSSCSFSSASSLSSSSSSSSSSSTSSSSSSASVSSSTPSSASLASTVSTSHGVDSFDPSLSPLLTHSMDQKTPISVPAVIMTKTEMASRPFLHHRYPVKRRIVAKQLGEYLRKSAFVFFAGIDRLGIRSDVNNDEKIKYVSVGDIADLDMLNSYFVLAGNIVKFAICCKIEKNHSISTFGYGSRDQQELYLPQVLKLEQERDQERKQHKTSQANNDNHGHGEKNSDEKNISDPKHTNHTNNTNSSFSLQFVALEYMTKNDFSTKFSRIAEWLRQTFATFRPVSGVWKWYADDRVEFENRNDFASFVNQTLK